MQLGHLPLALAIASFDWSLSNALFCVGLHYFPNVDSLVVKAGLDKKIILRATQLECWLKGQSGNGSDKQPEKDPFWVENGGFHCTVTHSLFFAIAVSLTIAVLSWQYAAFALVALLAHYAADIGSTVGLPLLWPFSRKKFTLALFRDTGWWGKEMFLGYYRQPMAWLLEGGAFAFFTYRMMSI